MILGLIIGKAQVVPVTAAAKKSPAALNMGHVYGKVLDTDGKPIAEASVVLLQSKYDTATKKNKEVLLKAMITKTKGEFSFEELPIFGSLKLKITAIGFTELNQPISFQMKMPAAGSVAAPAGDAGQAMGGMNAFDKDLGNIKLKAAVNQLAEVTVTATKPTLKMDIDKKVYNVEKDIVNAGGTAMDVMKNVPSVNVDIDGNVTLRNATPQIYIDGRPTTLTLDQIPADAIESVEIITNPSAKYDASGGGAGILNIVLKKNRKTGYNGNVRTGVDSHGAVNAGANFNLRQDKFNFSASCFYNENKGITNGTTNRYNISDTPTVVHQTNIDKNGGGFLFGSVGMDYFMTNRTTVSLTGIRVHGLMTPTQMLDITTDSIFQNRTSSAYSQRATNSTRDFNASGVQFGIKHLFPKEGENWTADLNYFSGKNNNNSLYQTDYYADGPGSSINGTQLQKVIGTGTNKFITIQTDYVNPISSTTKLETGLRFNSQHMVNNQQNYIDSIGESYYTLIPSASSNYTNTNNVYAGYISFTSAIKDFGYKLGLRAESSNYTGELTNLNETYSNKYPISLFPSVFLSQKLANRQELQVSYTRRINRPNFFQLIPFTDYTDSLNITRGNPNLVPEFTNSLEFSYLKTIKGNNTLLASLYYKQTNHLITRYLDTATSALTGKSALINTWENANSSYTAGAEVTGVFSLTKWWDITANVNIYNSKINTSNITTTSQPDLWSWFGKLNTSFKLPAKFKLQLTGTYQSKTNLPVSSSSGQNGPPGMGASQSASQGYVAQFWSMDAAISRSFLKNDAATISVSMNDVFRTRWTDQHSATAYFVQDYDRLRDPQMVRVNFTWRFGKMDVSLFKRKNMSSSGSQDAMQGMNQ